MTAATDSLNTRRSLAVGDLSYDYFSLPAAADAGAGDVGRLPYSLKVLLENLLRHEDGVSVTADDIKALGQWVQDRYSDREIAYRPARVLMQDFTGVPAVVDLAAMRQAMLDLGGAPKAINPLNPVDLIIDHSVQVDFYGGPDAARRNVAMEYERNGERYAFLRWGQSAFDNFRVVPPGMGICHQVNLEYLGRVVWSEKIGNTMVAYPDTLVGTDSHTTMINGLSVLGWGVGGIEAEAAMLGQPVSMVIPEVIGFKLTGALHEGVTATDLVLTVTEMLRKKGVVGKFVEFYGPGLDKLPLADRATIGNMSPEYGATCGIFPIDAVTLEYLRFTGRDEEVVRLVEAYAKEQGLWRQTDTPDPVFTDTLELDLSSVEPSLAGPRRPQDRVSLSKAAKGFDEALPSLLPKGADPKAKVCVDDIDHDLTHGDVVIAAITSCTNTSNPSVLIAAGLLARKAREHGLRARPWVKTSLAPGSKVVTRYYAKTGLDEDLDALGFETVGYGCTTCIGNSGPLPEPIDKAVREGKLVVSAVLSGNRNFEGRIHPLVRAAYLASPPLVVAYALAGTMRKDLTTEPLAVDYRGKKVYLRDVWPTSDEVTEAMRTGITADMYREVYATIFDGDEHWQTIGGAGGMTYDWEEKSTYVKLPPYFVGMDREPKPVDPVKGARILALLGDSITTDHISPAGSIAPDSPAGKYLLERGVTQREFNSYGARRGNHEVMLRGTFANVRIRNEMVPGTEGGYTKLLPEGDVLPIYDAAMKYQERGTPLVVVAGKEYGSGSSRDWAAKGTLLLGVKAVIAESFERIHRSNLVGMGVLPLTFEEGTTRETLGLDGTETVDILGMENGIKPGMTLTARFTKGDGGGTNEAKLLCRVDTEVEAEYYRHGGILHYVLRQLAQRSGGAGGGATQTVH